MIEQEKVEMGASTEAFIKRIDFLRVQIHYDREVAEKRYEEELEQNIDGMKDSHISFNQWLTEREIEALGYHISLY